MTKMVMMMMMMGLSGYGVRGGNDTQVSTAAGTAAADASRREWGKCEKSRLDAVRVDRWVGGAYAVADGRSERSRGRGLRMETDGLGNYGVGYVLLNRWAIAGSGSPRAWKGT